MLIVPKVLSYKLVLCFTVLAYALHLHFVDCLVTDEYCPEAGLQLKALDTSLQESKQYKFLSSAVRKQEKGEGDVKGACE